MAALEQDEDPMFAFFVDTSDKWNPLGPASTLDRIVWDKSCRERISNFAALSIFTRQIQGNILTTWRRKTNIGLDPVAVEPSYYRRAGNRVDAQDRFYFRGRGFFVPAREGCEDWIVWNTFEVKESERDYVPGVLKDNMNGVLPDIRNKKTEWQFILFQRCCVLLRHPCRSKFSHLPLICRDALSTEGLNDKNEAEKYEKVRDQLWSEEQGPSPRTNARACAALYWRLCKEKNDWVTAVGAPMCENLDQLSSVIADSTRRVVLVTGLPGTGKENYCKAMHYAGMQCTGDSHKSFLLTTARKFLQSTWMQETEPDETDTEKVADILENGGTLFLDELNKVTREGLSDLLRVLEEPAEVFKIPTADRDKFRLKIVLAASEHLDDLAKTPPQDFWTRVSNQVRVAHPLGRVPEEDARAFLQAFFWWEWWKLVQKRMEPPHGVGPQEVEIHGDFVRQIARFLLGPLAGEVSRKKTDPPLLVDTVIEEFVDTLAPMANKDELSVRGARSMVAQVFSRVVWACGYGLGEAGGDPREQRQDRKARKSVNRAIQDVLAILTATRATPRSLQEDNKSGGESKKNAE